MRKDVKIGLGIGGVLLAVLLVYILVPKTDDSRIARDDDVANTAEDRQDGVTSGSGANGATPGGSQGASPEQVTGPDVGRDAIATNPGSTGSQQTPRLDTGGGESEMSRATTAKPVDWDRILTTGIVPEDARIPLVNPSGRTTSDDPFSEPTRAAPPPEPGPEVTWNNAGPTPPGPTGVTSQRPSNSVARTGLKEHVIHQGETLSTISLAAYGDARYYKEILKANPALDERKLKPGTVIKIPDPSTFSTRQAQQAVYRQEAAVDGTKEYRVAAGDSLHKIAMKLYGKAAKADDLYELNKDTIGPDSARLKIGMVLKLPEAPAASAR
jgi:nucleoid-associated protein YgaU